MSKDTALGDGLSIASKSGVPGQLAGSVVGTVLVVVVQSSGLVVGWLSGGGSGGN